MIVLDGGMAAHPKGQMSSGYILAYDKKIIPSFKAMTDEIHGFGTKVMGQLSHCGSTVLCKPPQIMYAPTQKPEVGSRYNCKEMEIDEIKDVVKYFGLSAETMREAGADGVELKIAHDGLLRSFAAPFSNERTDEYGGSYKNRMRLLKEVIEEIRRKVGQDYIVGARLSLDEFTPWGYDFDYGIQMAKSLEEWGLDYIDTDAATQGNIHMQQPNMFLPLGYAVYMSAKLKKEIDIPVIAFGRINDPVMAEQILAEGNADFIGMARQLACDPETPKKTMEGRLDDIRHCIGCNDGCVFQVLREFPLHCVQNPGAGREAKYGMGTLAPAKQKKKIMVIGGGVAGLKFAEVAAARGHDVSLYEKSDKLAGQINIAEKIPYRIEISEVTRYLRMQLEKYKVPVHLNTEVDAALVKKENPDVVIVATGSIPFVPDLPGKADSSVRVMDVREAITHPELIGNNVVVVDKNGHWQGAGLGLFVEALGAQVTYVTPHYHIGVDMEPGTLNLIHKILFENGRVNLITHHDVARLEGSSVILLQEFNLR